MSGQKDGQQGLRPVMQVTLLCSFRALKMERAPAINRACPQTVVAPGHMLLCDIPLARWRRSIARCPLATGLRRTPPTAPRSSASPGLCQPPLRLSAGVYFAEGATRPGDACGRSSKHHALHVRKLDEMKKGVAVSRHLMVVLVVV